MSRWNWKDRARAAAVHLAICLLIATLAALLVFIEWYPYPYREISGGRELFLILVTVDVILGPLITLMIFSRAKPAVELRRDLATIGLLQVAALAYGMWSVFLARPVHLVFEFDRFRVVHAAEVPKDIMDKVPAGVQAMPLFGPTLLAVRPFRDEKERMEATMVALQGVSLSSRPDLWEPYAQAVPRVLEAAHPVGQLKARFPQRAGEIDALLSKAGRKAQDTGYLPMAGRKTFWTAFIDADEAQVIGFLPIDSF